jgi:hypothetical protein
MLLLLCSKAEIQNIRVNPVEAAIKKEQLLMVVALPHVKARSYRS